MEQPNIGKIIREVLAKQGRTITWLAQQLGTTRNLVYKMLDREIIYTDRLIQISELLDYDFFKHYSDYLEERKKEKLIGTITDDTIITTENGESITVAELKRRMIERK